ncbi:DNA glycosylase/AP lyase ROS1 [Rhododendron vialii]|uniref:DNA glycosylase/AP lyase ROS1 n=1 Tax=Rhododendron vialii TaxID=182163 RepID=UPI0026605281|nr:DNA glycosylase/AP lyase ROS1 [Rhododendron vialii]
MCFSCNSMREADAHTVKGTILIPCRTVMRVSFPLNGTYFQVNEMFADHESSLNPIDVPRAWIWNLPRRTVYIGTSVSTIFKGLTSEGIQYCFWRGTEDGTEVSYDSRSSSILLRKKLKTLVSVRIVALINLSRFFFRIFQVYLEIVIF